MRMMIITSEDWTGNKNSTYTTLGASNHVENERAEHDYYATDTEAAELLLQIEPNLSDSIWECACGENALSDVFKAHGKTVRCSDLIVRKEGIEQLDFLTCNEPMHETDIVTNPPYKLALPFIEKALSLVDEGRYVCMFLKLTFLEGKSRCLFFNQNPPIRVWVSSSRLNCWPNGIVTNSTSAACYAWFVWKKGYKGYPEIRWFN